MIVICSASRIKKKKTHNVLNRKKKKRLLKKGAISCFLRRLLADT